MKDQRQGLMMKSFMLVFVVGLLVGGVIGRVEVKKDEVEGYLDEEQTGEYTGQGEQQQGQVYEDRQVQNQENLQNQQNQEEDQLDEQAYEQLNDYQLQENQQDNYQQSSQENLQENDEGDYDPEDYDYYGDEISDNTEGTEGNICQIDTDCDIPEMCLDRKCFNRCRTTKCPGGSVCVHSKCIPKMLFCKKDRFCKIGSRCIDNQCQKCPRGICRNCGKWPYCPIGTTCKNNICVPNIKVCPADAKYKATVCPNIRPTETNCPGRAYIQSPPNRFCGINSNNQRIDFDQQCQACKRRDIIYYFNQPCHKAPFLCKSDEKCLGYYCAKQGCEVDDDCPYDWQTCNNNLCEDRCNLMDCFNTNCRFSECGYEEASGRCSVLRGQECKKQQWVCIGNQCIQRCIKTACPPFNRCEANQCIPY